MMHGQKNIVTLIILSFDTPYFQYLSVRLKCAFDCRHYSEATECQLEDRAQGCTHPRDYNGRVHDLLAAVLPLVRLCHNYC